MWVIAVPEITDSDATSRDILPEYSEERIKMVKYTLGSFTAQRCSYIYKKILYRTFKTLRSIVDAGYLGFTAYRRMLYSDKQDKSSRLIYKSLQIQDNG